jgi:hypothetical protein
MSELRCRCGGLLILGNGRAYCQRCDTSTAEANPPAVSTEPPACPVWPHIDCPACGSKKQVPPLTDEELEDAAIALDNFAEFLAEDDEIGPSKALATKLRGMKGRG